MSKKEVTIHKRNEILRGTDLYSLNGKRCFNAIYYIYQKHRSYFKRFEDRNINFIVLKFSTLRELMNLQNDNNYVEIIENAIKELQTTLIELNNWTNPIDGKTYKWYSTKFINDAKIYREDTISVHIEISTLFRQLMRDQMNFTSLDIIKYLNRFRTKYAMKIYEYLKSFGGYKYIDITQKHMMKLLALEENHQTYKHYSKLKQLIERQLKEIAKKTDLADVRLVNSKVLSKEKKFRIIINPKARKKVKNQDAKKILDSLIKRF